MRRLIGIAAALLSAIALGWYLTGPGPSPDSGGAAGARKTLRIGLTQYPSTFHPGIDAMAAKAFILGAAHRPLLAYNADWRLTCRLCTEVPSRANGRVRDVAGPDGAPRTQVRFTLPEQARWGDGRPVTSQDVIFSWRVGRAPGSGYAVQQLLTDKIVDIEAADSRNFTITYDKRYCRVADLAAFPILPAHVERPVFEAGETTTYRQRTAYDTDPFNPALYAGPYRIADREADGYVVLERNPEWWGEPPHFDKIIVRVIKNTAALEANLLAGEIDVLAGEVGGNAAQAIRFAERHADAFEALVKPSLFYEHIDPNFDNPILADRRVRQALLYAIDRQAISRELFGGRQPVAHSNVNPLDPVHWDDTPQYRFNPEQAAALLDAAGFARRNDNGIRVTVDGEPLRLSFQTTAGNKTRERVQQILQQQWRDAGIDVRIDNQPARVLFGETTRRRRFDGLIMYAWLSAPESVPRSTLHSDLIPREENNWAGQNYPGYANAEMDAILDGLEDTCAPEPRQALWRRLQQLYARQLPALPLYFRSVVSVHPPWLEGMELTGHLAPSTLWIEEWGVADRSIATDR